MNRGLSTVGPGMDSYFEYLMKGYALLGDEDLYDTYIADTDSVYAVQYIVGNFVPAEPENGTLLLNRPFSGLQMFWPLLPVYEGDLYKALEVYASNVEVCLVCAV